MTLHVVESKAAKPRVAIASVRFSSKMQNPKSLDEQEAEIREKAAREGVRIVGIEKDVAKSGTRLAGRDGLERALRRLEAGEANEIWFWDTDRIARDEADYFETVWKRVVDRASARVVDCFGFDSDKQEARLLGGVKAIIAAEESRKTGARTARGIKGRISNGYWHGPFPFGYRTERTTDARGFAATKIFTEPENARVVVQIFELVAQGIGCKALATRLNEDGAPSPLGTGWRSGTIAKMVKRTALYLGTASGIERPELRIISDTLAARARAAMTARNHASGVRSEGRFTPGPHASGRAEHLLTGWFKCPECGSALRAYRTGSNKRYQCSSHMTGQGCSNRVSANAAVANAKVVEAVRLHVLSPDALNYARAKLEAAAKTAERESASTRGKLSRSRSEIETKLQRLAKAIENGAGDVQSLVGRMRELEAQQAGISAELQLPMTQEIALALHPTKVRKLIESALQVLGNDPKRARPLLAALLGEPKLEIASCDHGRHRSFYRAHFSAHPAAIALTGTLSHRVTGWTSRTAPSPAWGRRTGCERCGR